jgi:hypothetical protein
MQRRGLHTQWCAKHGCSQRSCCSPHQLLLRLLLAAAVASGIATALKPNSANAAAPSFTRDIKPLLSERCIRCHGPDAEERQGGGENGLRLDTAEGATADLGGYAAIVAGKPDESKLLARLTTNDPDLRMPPPEAGEAFSAEEVATVRDWIASGADYLPHWSYVPPVRPPLPSVQNESWVRTPIDRFVLARLEAEGVTPQQQADRATLARRLALDLTGLPIAPEDVDAFLADPSSDAVEQLVDRLLAHEGYGEHMARQWLDLARYADSAGYADDPPRTIWAYRDWVVRAFDANMPFDEFTIKQLAGDLLPDATLDDQIATAFHRNTLTNSEGGTIDEEFRSVAIVDRVNTTLSTWMGTTIACAQCHSHKYDPITQEEFFQVYAVFNNTADADRRDETPVVTVPWEPVDAKRAPLEAEIAEITKEIPELAKPAEQQPPEFRPARTLLEERRKQLAAVPRPTVPVLQELTGDKRRVTSLQYRGNWQDLGPEVSEGVPAVFETAAVAAADEINRLVLAKWLVDPANPLTARVVVNRLWERFFGIGIVATSEEFGSQGELPSHPELLDWLAVELIERDWDLKAIIRLIVTSTVYRQQSQAPAELVGRDPENRLLARGPRVRLSAEEIRDQALAAAGLLSRKKGGPSVNPPQPSLGLSAAFGGGIDWQPSTGEDRYRRGLYTTWRRSNPYPSMATFDAPNREVCTVRRPSTNTPLQALVTLNDPVYVEAAQALARRMVAETPGVAGQPGWGEAQRGFRLVLGRQPSDAELSRLVALYDEALAGFEQAPEDAMAVATDPLGPLPDDLANQAPRLAAWTVVANVILNLDEAFMCP